MHAHPDLVRDDDGRPAPGGGDIRDALSLGLDATHSRSSASRLEVQRVRQSTIDTCVRRDLREGSAEVDGLLDGGPGRGPIGLVASDARTHIVVARAGRCDHLDGGALGQREALGERRLPRAGASEDHRQHQKSMPRLGANATVVGVA